METSFDPYPPELAGCRLCPRLAAYREQVAREKRRAYRDQDYWGAPVPGFGDPEAVVLQEPPCRVRIGERRLDQQKDAAGRDEICRSRAQDVEHLPAVRERTADCT